MGVTRQDAINDALERLYDLGFAVDPGFAAHGPMGAEAVSALGRNDAVSGWVEAYKAKWHHRPLPPLHRKVDGANEPGWRAALGDRNRAADWLEFFRRALAEAPWQNVLRRWATILVEGSAGGLNHGLIRTAHALRSFPDDAPPSALELDELARGLAYWAGSYRVVAGDPDRHGALTLQDALRRLPRLPAEKRGAFSLDTLGDLTGYVDVVEGLLPITDVKTATSHHTAVFARLLVAHPELRQVPLIELIHAITGPAALRVLLPYMPDEFGIFAYARLWRVSAAIVADVAGAHDHETDPEIGAPAWSVDELITRAIEHRDEHVIKLTDVLLQEDRLNPDPIYRIAAESIFPRIRAWK